MPETTSSPIQPEQLTVPVPQPKSSNKLLVVALLITTAVLFAGLGAGGYYLLTRNKKEATPTTPERQSCTYNNQAYNDSASFDATDGCNTCLCNNGNVVCTELNCTKESNGTTNDGNEIDPYSGWNTYTNDLLGYTVRYPDDYTLDSSEERCVSLEKGDVLIDIGRNNTDDESDVLFCFRSGIGAYDIDETTVTYTINNETYPITEWYEKVEQEDGTFGNIYGAIKFGEIQNVMWGGEYWGHPKEVFEAERETVTKIIESITW